MPDTTKLREEHEREIVGSDTVKTFEQAMNTMLQAARHEPHRVLSREAATGGRQDCDCGDPTEGEDRATASGWMFQDVHPGGVAAQAGIQSGDVLLKVGDKELVPPEAMPFVLGETYSFTVRRADGSIVERHSDHSWIERESSDRSWCQTKW